jgi:shikimate dehydrogenase/3-dehydroquinate dehydratase type I
MARICVPVCVHRLDELPSATNAAASASDIVELRADCLPASDAASILQTVRELKRPLILTLRSPEEGGQSENNFDARRRFWTSLQQLPSDALIDLELDLVEEFSRGESTGSLKVDWRHVICSYHDFDRTPDNLPEMFDRMVSTEAGIIKIAVHSADAIDCLAVFDLLDRAKRIGRDLIAISMGEPGVMTRVLGPARGSFLTYGSIDDERATAPGQLTAGELRELYRIDGIDGATQVFGIIGTHVSHSLSPHIHNAAFAASELNAVYIPFQVHEPNEFIRRMVHPKTRELDWNLNGLSVTAPHKSIVMQQLDWIAPACREIGACNTVVVRDNQLLGYNTDAEGFVGPLRDALGSIRDVRCAVVGAGGAARACVWALKREAADVTVFARDKSKAEFLAQTFGLHTAQLPTASFKGFDVVINTTPLGTRGEYEDQSIANAEQLQGVRLAYDLVYNPGATKFLREAAMAGCTSLSGLEMLLGQAVEQFKLWTGKTPDLEIMRTAALRKLQSQTGR